MSSRLINAQRIRPPLWLFVIVCVPMVLAPPAYGQHDSTLTNKGRRLPMLPALDEALVTQSDLRQPPLARLKQSDALRLKAGKLFLQNKMAESVHLFQQSLLLYDEDSGREGLANALAACGRYAEAEQYVRSCVHEPLSAATARRLKPLLSLGAFAASKAGKPSDVLYYATLFGSTITDHALCLAGTCNVAECAKLLDARIKAAGVGNSKRKRADLIMAGHAYMTLGKYKEASTCLRQAKELGQDIDTLHLESRVCYAEADSDTAARVLTEWPAAARQDPLHREVIDRLSWFVTCDRARALHQQQRYADALAAYRTVAHIQPVDAGMAGVYADMKDWKTVSILAAKAYQECALDGGPLYLQAKAMAKLGKTGEAIDLFTKLVRYPKFEETAVTHRCALYLVEGKRKLAERDLQYLQSHFPSQNYDLSRIKHTAVKNYSPDFMVAWNVAQSEPEAMRLSRIKELNAAMSLGPPSARRYELLTERGRLELRLNQFGKSLEDAEASIQLHPDQLAAHELKAAALYALQKFDLASAERSKVLALYRQQKRGVASACR